MFKASFYEQAMMHLSAKPVFISNREPNRAKVRSGPTRELVAQGAGRVLSALCFRAVA